MWKKIKNCLEDPISHPIFSVGFNVVHTALPAIALGLAIAALLK